MEKFNIKLNYLRKLYLNNKEFVIMIRDELNDINRNTKKDIVYYNGIKALEINKKDKEIKEIVIKDNIYKINTTNVKNNSKENIINSIREVRKSIKDYLCINLKRIEFQMSKNTHLFEGVLNNFRNEIKECIDKGYTDCFVKNKLTGKKKDTIVYYIEFDFNKEIIENAITDDILNKMLEVEYSFIKNFKINEKGVEPYIIKNVNFIFNNNRAEYKKDENINASGKVTNIKDEVNKINRLNNSVKHAIEEYEKLTKEELEKKYQHHFMISNNTLRKLDSFENLYRFEEEYYTDENTKEDRGRVDCIFLKVDRNILTDIYLIELKVNENVIGKSNGIHKHLIDIEKLLNDPTKKHHFIDKLYERVNYRRKIERLTTLKKLTEEKKEQFYNKINFHFYTIISFTDTLNEVDNKIDFENIKHHIKTVTRLLKKFDVEQYINENKLENNDIEDKEQKLPCESELLKKHMCRLNDIYKCDTKIYYDIYWNKKDIDSKKLFLVYYKNNLINDKLEKEIEDYIKYLETEYYE